MQPTHWSTLKLIPTTPLQLLAPLLFFISSYECSAISVQVLDSQLSCQRLLYASTNWLLIPCSDCEGVTQKTVLLRLKWGFDVKTIRRSGFNGGAESPRVWIGRRCLQWSLKNSCFLRQLMLGVSLFIIMGWTLTTKAQSTAGWGWIMEVSCFNSLTAANSSCSAVLCFNIALNNTRPKQ